jgi:hypothetical protein
MWYIGQWKSERKIPMKREWQQPMYEEREEEYMNYHLTISRQLKNNKWKESITYYHSDTVIENNVVVYYPMIINNGINLLAWILPYYYC